MDCYAFLKVLTTYIKQLVMFSSLDRYLSEFLQIVRLWLHQRKVVIKKRMMEQWRQWSGVLYECVKQIKRSSTISK